VGGCELATTGRRRCRRRHGRDFVDGVGLWRLGATGETAFGFDLHVVEPRANLGDGLAVADVGVQVDLADPERALVLAFGELVQERVLDLELAELGDEVCDAEGAVAAGPDLLDEKFAFDTDHGFSS